MTTLPETSIVLVVGSTRAAYLPRVAEWSYVWTSRPQDPVLRRIDSDQGSWSCSIADHTSREGPEMARNERRYDWLGLQQSAMRDWFADVVARLTLVAKANDCYLYALPSLTR